jgi:ATP-binding cassette subfamily B protein
MWKLFKYLKPYWKVVTVAPLFLLVEVIMDLMQPLLMASIINEGVLTGDLAHIQKVGLYMIGLSLVGLLGGIGSIAFTSIASQSFAADLRKSLFQKVQSFSFNNLDKLKTGSLITRLTNDVVQIQTLVQMTMRILIRAPLLAIGSCIMAFMISPRLAIVLAIVVPLLFISMFILLRIAFPMYTKVQQKLDNVNIVLQENLAGIRVVKAFVRTKFENKRFAKSNEDYMNTAIKAARIVSLNMPIMSLIMNASIVAVLWFGGNLEWQGSIQLGDLIAFINYVTTVLFSLSLVAMMMVFVSRAKASADRVQEVLNTESEIVSPPLSEVTNTIQSGRVLFDQVSYTYFGHKGEPVLQDISFSAEPGRTVAILGATGSGKSTLVSLIPRLYDPTEGRVLIDGIDIRQIGLDHLRSQIGVVLQEAILFTGTIRENIAFGKPEATQEEIEQAAEAAQAHNFITGMPDGYETIIGQRGINLSGGQKQRISIARALLVRPKILILDDSTSAVDLGTEYRIQQALKRLMRSSTNIIIAQRISSVMEADQILVLEEGRVVAEGTHDQLMLGSDVYRDIYSSQLGEEEAANG